MNLASGTQIRLIQEAPTQAGTISRELSLETDAVLVTLWASSVDGTLDVSVYALTDTGKETILFTFPQLSAGTTDLLLRKSGVATQRVRVVATYSDACDYEIYTRAVTTAGESTARLLGASNLRTSTASVTTSAAVLIASSLTDRSGLMIKNTSASDKIFIAESLVKATSLLGYPVDAGESLGMDVAAGVTIYAVSSSGTIDIRILEAGG